MYCSLYHITCHNGLEFQRYRHQSTAAKTNIIRISYTSHCTTPETCLITAAKHCIWFKCHTHHSLVCQEGNILKIYVWPFRERSYSAVSTSWYENKTPYFSNFLFLSSCNIYGIRCKKPYHLAGALSGSQISLWQMYGLLTFEAKPCVTIQHYSVRAFCSNRNFN